MSATLDVISNRYFDWLYSLMTCNRYSKAISYKKLFTQLHSIEFRYSIRNDGNRAEDGVDLRYRFAITEMRDVSEDIVLDVLDGPCSVLEMMIALAIRCEEGFMDDSRFGDRTAQWFWRMISNLGLSGMRDNNFDKGKVDYAITRFLDHKYEPDGTGGLFIVRNCDRDLRKVEIWYQLCYYLNEIT